MAFLWTGCWCGCLQLWWFRQWLLLFSIIPWGCKPLNKLHWCMVYIHQNHWHLLGVNILLFCSNNSKCPICWQDSCVSGWGFLQQAQIWALTCSNSLWPDPAGVWNAQRLGCLYFRPSWTQFTKWFLPNTRSTWGSMPHLFFQFTKILCLWVPALYIPLYVSASSFFAIQPMKVGTFCIQICSWVIVCDWC